MSLAVVATGAAAYVSAFGAGAAAAGVLIVGDVADAAYFGVKGLESAIESEEFYEFAAGASLILGDELLLDAEAQRESVGMALVGLIAPGIGVGFGLKDLRHFKNIDKGKAILKTKGVKAPLRRNVTGRDVGDAAAFLLSDMSSGITGQTIYVDCGFSAVG